MRHEVSTAAGAGVPAKAVEGPLRLVRRAEVFGLCFGVRDALDLAFARDDAEQVTIYGQLVHNEEIQARLDAQGYRRVSESGRAGAVETDKVLITAHGLSNRETARLRGDGRELIDTTCPLVRRAHHAALRLREAGYFVIVIGQPGHVEVQGLVGDLDEYAVIASPKEARELALSRVKLGVLTQTTFAEDRAEAIVAALGAANPAAEIRFYNTVCEPTRQRRQAVVELCRSVDAVVVVGGKNSNNCRELLLAAERQGVAACLVQGPDDLCAEWFAGRRVIGLSAGTSTRQQLVEAVELAILALP